MTDLQDKIMLITGASDGIGKITAHALARQGAHIVLLGRNGAKTDAARQEIIAATGNQRVDVVVADLSNLGQVRAVAAEITTRYPRLDVLVNNAGALFGKERAVSADGNELTLATNHLGPFLLTSLLFDLLQKSPAARVVNVSSEAHQLSRPTLEDIQSERRYNNFLEYGTTKLFNILFTQELARRLRAHGITNVTTNSLQPGAVATNFGRQSWWSWYMLLARLTPARKTPEQGAETSIFLAADPSVVTTSGGYFDKCKPKAVKSKFNTLANAQGLWELSEKLTGTTFLA